MEVVVGEAARDDRAVLSDVADGRAGALDHLYTLYARSALSLAYRMLGDRSEAEDVVQESFLAVWRSARSYDAERGSARTWLLRIVHNRCIDNVRGREVRPALARVATLDEHPDRIDVADDVVRQVRGEEVRAALDRLSDDQRAAIELAYFEGQTHREIAQKLGLPLGTVKGRMRLGLRALQGSLSFTM